MIHHYSTQIFRFYPKTSLSNNYKTTIYTSMANFSPPGPKIASFQDEKKLQAVFLAKNPRPFLKGFLAGSVLTLAVAGTAAYYYYWEDIQNRFKQQRAFEILKYGVPTRPPPIMYYANHVLAYDSMRKTPIWVAEHLTKKSTEGFANRKRCRFQPDPKLKETCFTASNDDFWNSGWSRGHMAPAGNNKHNQVAMDETFYLTNVVPQDIENNSGFWNRFEIYCRELTKRYKDVRLISGPLYMSRSEGNRKYVQYEVIGENNVAVPTHLYKIVVAENPHDSRKFVGAFVIPNAPISYEQSLTEFQVPLKALEKETGIKFMKKLDRYKVQDLCQVDGCRLLGKTDFQKYFLSRKLENTSTLKRLEKVWKEIEQYGLKKDQNLSKIYKDKKQLLMEHRPESERFYC
uniref:Endonuclease n=1 Tax=Strigamia maritima TaxID=126957 RepID=T1IRM1_STRMM